MCVCLWGGGVEYGLSECSALLGRRWTPGSARDVAVVVRGTIVHRSLWSVQAACLLAVGQV